jgi:hypothetical protein
MTPQISPTSARRRHANIAISYSREYAAGSVLVSKLLKTLDEFLNTESSYFWIEPSEAFHDLTRSDY